MGVARIFWCLCMIITVTITYVIKNSTVTGIIEVYLLTGDGCDGIKQTWISC